MSKIIDCSSLDLPSYKGYLEAKMMPQYTVQGRVVEIKNHASSLDFKDAETQEKHLFDYQRFIVDEATRKQRYAIFADCGLGKTAMFLAWIRRIQPSLNGKKILIVSPLMVVKQTIAEEVKFYGESTIKDIHNLDLDEWLKNGSEQVGITNFEKFIEHHDLSNVGAFILDESSILKHATGKIRTSLIESTRGIQWKLCCSATPAPNDREEYANHAAFLEYVRSNNEFFSMFFVNKDNGWEIKPHGLISFYKYLAQWSVYCRKPEKYGFNDNNANIPAPIFEVVPVKWTEEQAQYLGEGQKHFGGDTELKDAFEKRRFYIELSKGFIKRDGEYIYIPTNKNDSILKLLKKHPHEKAIVWVMFNEEEEIVKRSVAGAGFRVASISGKTDELSRADIVTAFKNGEYDVLISKPRLLGFGLNLQFVTVQIFSGLTDSYEQFYQCVRRSYRFGATEPVKVYMPVTNAEKQILANVMGKKDTFEVDSERQEDCFIENLKDDLNAFFSGQVFGNVEEVSLEVKEKQTGKGWEVYNGDCIPTLEKLSPESIDLAVFSPPFANLFTYSNNLEDMGNSRDNAEFYLHYEYFLSRLVKVMKPGRIVCCHLSQLATLKSKDGFVGLKDFRGDVISLFQSHGFIYFGEWCIAKNPQMQAIKEKVRSLSFAQLERDRLGSKPGMNDYILIFKKPGDSPVKVNDSSGPTRDEWIEWATGVWTGIRESNTLNVRGSKGEDDVKHICPMNLEVIRRCIRMYSAPDEVVLDPFMGIGSTGVVALQLERKFTGIELKSEYFNTSIDNLLLTKPTTTMRDFLVKDPDEGLLKFSK